jgi:hypothetical protein
LSIATILALIQGVVPVSAGPRTVPGSCTIFMAAFGDKVLYGNNEDWKDPHTYVWTSPAKEDAFGALYLGFSNRWPQGGVNEEGLAFDFNALPEAPLYPHAELPDASPNFVRVMATECATVAEAIEYLSSLNWGSSMRWQLLLADATGDAAVMSAGPDGEIAFTRKPPGDGFLASTNFNRANPSNGGGPTCWRYNRAVGMLERIEGEGDLTLEYFASILDAVHIEGTEYNTLYSNVFDLRNGIAYIYHWHQFDEVATIDVAERVATGAWSSRIEDLFSTETVSQASGEHQEKQAAPASVERLGQVCLALTAASFVAMVIALLRGKRPRLMR